METLTRVLARHVYNLDLSTTNGGGSGGACGLTRGRGRRAPAAPPPAPPASALASGDRGSDRHCNVDGRTPGECDL